MSKNNGVWAAADVVVVVVVVEGRVTGVEETILGPSATVMVTGTVQMGGESNTVMVEALMGTTSFQRFCTYGVYPVAGRYTLPKMAEVEAMFGGTL